MSYVEFLKSGWPFSDKADYEDVLVPRGESCIEISKLIARADEQAGEFSFGGSANMLPVAPGLFVTGAGPISTPLSDEQAEKLIVLCTKSPFGHNHDTKMDENVRKSWQLQPDLTQFKHPLWQTGMETLSKIVAERLGYRKVPLQCILYKLLVYGEGGHFVKHQDTEKEDGMIATLVIQLPSTHEGGDLVVYKGEKVTYRHDFGKADGTAAYLPHYAVHYADSEHALEEVTKGFRLVLVYSVCLPKTMRHLKKSLDQPLSELLAGVIENMDAENDSFALLLDHAYTEKSVRDLGAGALKGVDNSRFHVLEGANALVPEDKKLKFFIAQLTHDIHQYDSGFESELRGQIESIAWFSTEGELFGLVTTATTKLNFLNPRREVIAERWLPYEKITKKGGYTGNEGSTGITTYARFAIVAWVATKHPENALKFMPLEIAAKAFLTKNLLNDVEIQTFLNEASARLEAENEIRKKMDRNFENRDGNVSIVFCRTLCEILLHAEEPKLVNTFLKKFCDRLGFADDNDVLIQPIINLVSKFQWNEISEAVLFILSDFGDRGENLVDDGYSPMELLLLVADGLDPGTALDALVQLSASRAEKMEEKELFLSNYICLLWKGAIRCGTDTAFLAIAKKLENGEPDFLGPSIEYLTQYVKDHGDKDNKLELLLPSVVGKRIEWLWLKTRIETLEKPFSWEMPDAKLPAKDDLPEKDKVLEFLRSSEVSMQGKEAIAFKTVQDGHNFVAAWMREEQVDCSFEMKVIPTDGAATVTITKTRDLFLKQQGQLMKLKKELRDLTELYGVDILSKEAKRPRIE